MQYHIISSLRLCPEQKEVIHLIRSLLDVLDNNFLSSASKLFEVRNNSPDTHTSLIENWVENTMASHAS